jgi:hypothetical protein
LNQEQFLRAAAGAQGIPAQQPFDMAAFRARWGQQQNLGQGRISCSTSDSCAIIKIKIIQIISIKTKINSKFQAHQTNNLPQIWWMGKMGRRKLDQVHHRQQELDQQMLPHQQHLKGERTNNRLQCQDLGFPTCQTLEILLSRHILSICLQCRLFRSVSKQNCNHFNPVYFREPID